MYNFDFNIGNDKIPLVRINERGFLFNKHSIELLGNPKFIIIGIDKANKKLAVKPLDEKDENYHCYTFLKNNKKSLSVEIRATKLRAVIYQILGIYNVKKILTFALKEDNGIFIVHLD